MPVQMCIRDRISAGSDIGVLVGGFVLRLLVLLAALPVTMTVAWTL